MGNGLNWSAESAQAALPALLGHVLFGATAALTLALVQRRHRHGQQGTGVTRGALISGAVAGLLAVWLIGTILAAQGHLSAFIGGTQEDPRAAVWLLTLVIGLLAGVGYALLYPHPIDSAGAGIIRGAMYGFLLWVAVPLTLLLAIYDSELLWRLDQVREVFPSMPGYALFGAAMALLHQWLGTSARTLFSDNVAGGDQEGVGTQSLRSVVRGSLAGLVGSLVFTGVMVQTGALTGVATMIGATSPITGFFVHLVIANLVGASYGLLFRRQSYDVGSALGWGASYGFIWWLIGPLTLAPIFLGTTPQWTAEVAGELFPNLIGHLAYGAGLGVTMHLLEARQTPWWIPRRQADAARVAHRRAQVLTSAPALWTLVVIVSLTLSVLLGVDAPEGLPGSSD